MREPGALVPSVDAPLARVVHDLRAPLQAIRGQCFTLSRHPASGRQRAGLRAIDAEALRLSAALDDLLRLGGGPGPARRRGPLDLGALAAEAARRGAAAARLAHVHVRLRPEAGPGPAARGDAAAIRRALDNLIANAIRHSPRGGLVTVEVGETAGEARVVVRDRGPGVAPEDRERIFAAGVRGRDPVGAGLGLGLAIARDAAEADGGRLVLLPPRRPRGRVPPGPAAHPAVSTGILIEDSLARAADVRPRDRIQVVPRGARRGRVRPLDPDAVVQALLGAPGALVLARPSEADPGAACLGPLGRALGRTVLSLPARRDAAAWTITQGAAWIGEGAPRLEPALAVACALPGLPPGAAALPRRRWGDGDLVVPGVRPRALASLGGVRVAGLPLVSGRRPRGGVLRPLRRAAAGRRGGGGPVGRGR